MKQLEKFFLVFILLSILFSVFIAKAGIGMTLLMLVLFLLLSFISFFVAEFKAPRILGFNVFLIIFWLILSFYGLKIAVYDFKVIGGYLSDKYPFLLSFHIFLSLILGIIIAYLKKKSN